MAYWNNAKKPKTLEQVLTAIYRDGTAPKPDVDVDAFKERKRRFEELGGFTADKGRNLRTAR